MMISDVILEANSEHEIFFLLTAYVESIRYCDRLGTLPENLTRLPLSGIGDVQRKLEALNAGLGQHFEDCNGRTNAILREAADILRAALDRLQWLAREAAPSFGSQVSSNQAA